MLGDYSRVVVWSKYDMRVKCRFAVGHHDWYTQGFAGASSRDAWENKEGGFEAARNIPANIPRETDEFDKPEKQCSSRQPRHQDDGAQSNERNALGQTSSNHRNVHHQKAHAGLSSILKHKHHENDKDWAQPTEEFSLGINAHWWSSSESEQIFIKTSDSELRAGQLEEQKQNW